MRKAHLLTGVLLLICFGVAAFADVVVLKDGTIHRGDIIFKNQQIVIIKTDTDAVLRFPRENVIWITQTPKQPDGAQAVQEPVGLPLDEAVARLTDDLRASLEQAGGSTVAVAPFWGPDAAVNPLHDALAEKAAQKLRGANYRVIEHSTVQRVLNALRLERSALAQPELGGRLATILGADATVVGRITAVGANTVTVQVVLLKATTGETLAEAEVLIAKDAEVARLLGEKKPEATLEGSTTLRSAISTKFAPTLQLRAFYHKRVANKPAAKYEGDRISWTLESGNTAVVTSSGRVIVTSTKKLAEDGQARQLENDLSGIFINLSKMAPNYKSSEIHKDVEFDSVYYAEKPGVFHRFIIRERTDLTRRNWTLEKNGNKISHAKMSLIIEGSWAKLSLGKTYVVSFGRWTSRFGISAVDNAEETVSLKITPYGWIQWYVAVIDLVTDSTLTAPTITGWGSSVVEYRTNKLIEHLQLTSGEDSADTGVEQVPKRLPSSHTFGLP